MNLNKLLKREMKNKRKVYVYSETRDYMTAEYIDLFESMNAELVKEQKKI
jgi:hypothetical protein